jgi:DNA ligase D-like protein (predicted 3'-phosphoesterase)
MVKLREYLKKRDLKSSPEPKGGAAKAGAKKDIFVVQEHNASRLHYDFRLELGGVLKSWAVPKGPPLTPQEKRLAIPTEDHPLEYADFRGVIPKGNYGAGTVKTWDRGTFENIKKDRDGKPVSLKDSYENGTVEVVLKGRKLKGGYALVHMHGKKEWLMIKMGEKNNEKRT